MYNKLINIVKYYNKMRTLNTNRTLSFLETIYNHQNNDNDRTAVNIKFFNNRGNYIMYKSFAQCCDGLKKLHIFTDIWAKYL